MDKEKTTRNCPKRKLVFLELFLIRFTYKKEEADYGHKTML
jgi:hypothetical protein